MKNIALFSFLSVKDKLRTKAGFFDLYGIDFLIDDNMKVTRKEIFVIVFLVHCCCFCF